jgi:hypothetical protein
MASTEPSRDHVIFTAAMAMEAAHLLDDGLLNPHDGVTELPSTMIALAIALGAVAVYGRLATWARAVLAGLFGLAGLVAGVDMHVLHALRDGAAGSDYTGFGHAVAGLVLLVLAALLTLRPHPQPGVRRAGLDQG